MSFKGQSVWVRVDERGRPVLDPDGRAEMKYHEGDVKSYRPAPQNLAPESAGQLEQSVSRTSRNARAAVPASGAAGIAAGPVIQVWTDGACSGNPGPMGIGIVVVAGEARKEHGEYLGKGTNNIAELTAIRRGLEIADEIAPGRERAIHVYTDSSYSIGLLSQGWKAKANQALVAELRDFLRGYRNLRLIKVEGHAGVAENERCDLLARQAVARNRHL